jgi:hypothetical protein
MSASDKNHLRKTLESLLGFDPKDEGAGLDVLDHLLTIENRTVRRRWTKPTKNDLGKATKVMY